ncbi:MAG: hypothetical protein ACI4AQ_06330 [Lachnospiraceae bacterium]
MYANINKYFNYWPKTVIKIILVCCGFSMFVNTAVLVNHISTGFEDYILGILLHLIIMIHFFRVLRTQKTLKNAHMGKVWRKEFNFSHEQVEAALKQMDSEVTKPLYVDTTTKNTFMITENWLIGADSLSRATAVRLKDIKSYERLVVSHTKGITTTYVYYLVLKCYGDKEMNICLSSEDKVDDAACELGAVLKINN